MATALWTSAFPLHREKQHLSHRPPRGAPGATPGRRGTFAVRTGAPRTGDRLDRGAQSAGQRAHRAAVRDPPGPPGEGTALGRDRRHRSRQSLPGGALSSAVGRALHGGASQPAQCPPTAGSRTSPGGNPECARGPQGGRRSHRELGGKPLGRAAGRSLRGPSRGASRNRTAAGWLALVALPRPLPPPAALPGTGAARGKSFRPTASSPCRQSPLKSLQKCSSEPPMADISIWQKTGHFYFALTAGYFALRPLVGGRNIHLLLQTCQRFQISDAPFGQICLEDCTAHGKN